MRLPHCLILILCLASGARAEEAARILYSAGDVVLERGAQRMPVRPGMAVQTGDIVTSGQRAGAQLRFSDDTLVALGPSTRFRIHDYAYEPQGGVQRAFFNLIAGGMRAVTGLIGRTRHDQFGVQTATATIGVRGTTFAVCQDCVTTEGRTLPGTAVSFTEGHGFLRTGSGELPLATGESGYAPVANALPHRTLNFPTFQQQATSRTAPAPLAAAGSTGTGGNSTDKGDAGTPSGSRASTPTAATPAGPEVAGPAAGGSSVGTVQAGNTSSGATLLAPSFSGTIFYTLAGPFTIHSSCASPPCPTLTAGRIILGVNYALQSAFLAMSLQTSTGDQFNISSPLSAAQPGIPVQVAGHKVTFEQTYLLADYPDYAGAFRCSSCGSGGGAGYLSGFTVSGTVSGKDVRLTIRALNPDASTATAFSVTMPSTALPNNAVAAMVIPGGGGLVGASSAAYWYVTTDAQGRLTDFGPPDGASRGSIGAATFTLPACASAAHCYNATAFSTGVVSIGCGGTCFQMPSGGSLRWGLWSSGASFEGGDYVSSTSARAFPWIDGTAADALPPSLGTLAFRPMGWIINGGNGTLDAAHTSLSADLLHRTISLSIEATGSSATYRFDGVTGLSPSNSRFSARFNTVTCLGGACAGSPSGAYAGFLTARAAGAGLSFVGPGVEGVLALRR